MKPKLIPFIFLLYVTYELKMVVDAQKRCGIDEFCNLADCTQAPPQEDDENKLDAACLSSKCDFIREDQEQQPRYGNLKKCILPGKCKLYQWCGPGCAVGAMGGQTGRFGRYCMVGLNCDKSYRCADNKPKCKLGEYCFNVNCKRKPPDTKDFVSLDRSCKSGRCSRKMFRCVRFNQSMPTPKPPPAEEGKKKREVINWWMWVIIVSSGFVIVSYYGFLLFWCLMFRKNKATDLDHEKEEKKFKIEKSKGSIKSKKSVTIKSEKS